MHRTCLTMGRIAAAAALTVAAWLMPVAHAGQPAQGDAGCAKPVTTLPARKAAAVDAAVVKATAAVHRAGASKAAAQPARRADDRPADHEREVWRHQGVG